MALLSEAQERSWATNKYGETPEILSWKFDWRDTRIMDWINNFEPIATKDSQGNISRLKLIRTHRLQRSLKWKTWAASGGDVQVFRARYIYYSKFVELAVGGKEKYKEPVPNIPGPKWGPITVPNRKRKGKPFVVTEMRTQAAKFTAYASAQFSFTGTVFLLFAMGNNKSTAAAYNRALAWAMEQGKAKR